MPQRDIVIFDLGGVLLDWDPRHLYRQLFPGDEAAMEHFLAKICNSDWNRQQDAGRLVAEATGVLKAAHPSHAELIDAYYARHLDMIAGPVEGSVAILAELRERGTPLYFLSNYSAETYPLALARFEFLSWFRGGIVSSEHGIIKPTRKSTRSCSTVFRHRPTPRDLYRRQRRQRRQRHPRHPFPRRRSAPQGTSRAGVVVVERR